MHASLHSFRRNMNANGRNLDAHEKHLPLYDAKCAGSGRDGEGIERSLGTGVGRFISSLLTAAA